MPRFPTRVVRAIIAKDLRDALRDGRLMLGAAVIVGVALVMDLGTAEDARSAGDARIFDAGRDPAAGDDGGRWSWRPHSSTSNGSTEPTHCARRSATRTPTPRSSSPTISMHP
jgi:hypothetical protein